MQQQAHIRMVVLITNMLLLTQQPIWLLLLQGS